MADLMEDDELMWMMEQEEADQAEVQNVRHSSAPHTAQRGGPGTAPEDMDEDELMWLMHEAQTETAQTHTQGPDTDSQKLASSDKVSVRQSQSVQDENTPLNGTDKEPEYDGEEQMRYLEEAELPEADEEETNKRKPAEGSRSSPTKRPRARGPGGLDDDVQAGPSSAAHTGGASAPRADFPSTSTEVSRGTVPPARRADDIQGECMSVTAPSGERVYIQVDKADAKAQSSAARRPPRTTGGLRQLLSEPIDTLLDRIEERRYREIVQESERLDARAAELAHSAGRGALHLGRGRQVKKVEDAMWVDKYSPRAFTELLSDEKINREVLRWVKAWDTTVFGVPAKTTPPAAHAAPYGTYTSSNYTKFSRSGLPLEEDGRPVCKVILLCGPPGLGKTTLAHVVAKHCGYRVIEINASDDRSATALRTKIRDAIDYRPVLGQSSPNCVVVDEVDGVAAGAGEAGNAIDVLVKMATATRARDKEPVDDDAAPASSKATRKGRKKEKLLTRPVICICNDAFSPMLRPLRDVARVFVFEPPAPGRLYKRLTQVCEAEGAAVEGRALSSLCAKTQCDVRSCLHSLQFLAAKGEEITAAHIAAASLGQKDLTVQAKQVWEDIFHRKKVSPFAAAAQQGASGVGAGSGGGRAPGSAPDSDWEALYGKLVALGDDQLVLSGVHHNMLHVRYHDVHLAKTVQSLEWVGASDLLQRAAGRTMNFSLMPYVPFAALAVRQLTAGPLRPEVEWPAPAFQTRRDKLAREALLASWMKGVGPQSRRSLSRTVAAKDTVPHLVPILAPALRAVAPQMLHEAERADLRTLVHTMLDFGLSFSIQPENYALAPAARDRAGTFIPAIDCLTAFELLSQQVLRRSLPMVMRQMVLQELQLERIRRTASANASQSGDGATLEAVAGDVKATRVEQEQEQRADQMKQQMKKLQPKAHKASKVGGTSRANSLPVLYKFHEGFTNAVRRNVLMHDLLSAD